MSTTGRRSIRFYLPGMFNYLGERGLYPAISITGPSCELSCAHCQGHLLKDMIPARTPEDLVRIGLELEQEGNVGCLISGGSNAQGELDWAGFVGAIKTLKSTTHLKISVHTGLVGPAAAAGLKDAGVDQVLIDVVGADQTLQLVCNLKLTTEAVYRSLQCLFEADLVVIPHILLGLHYGTIVGEYRALEMLGDFPVRELVFIILNPLPGTPMARTKPLEPSRLGDFIARARDALPHAAVALGCARPRDRSCFEYEKVAIDGGVAKIAFPSEQAIDYARQLDMEVTYEKTCCSW